MDSSTGNAGKRVRSGSIFCRWIIPTPVRTSYKTLFWRDPHLLEHNGREALSMFVLRTSSIAHLSFTPRDTNGGIQGKLKRAVKLRLSWVNGGPQIIVWLRPAVFSAGWPTDDGLKPLIYKGKLYL